MKQNIKKVNIMKVVRRVINLGCVCLLFMQTAFSQTSEREALIEGVFRKYLMTGDESYAKMLADSKEENTYSLFGKAVLTDNAEEAIDLYTKFIEKKTKYGLGEAYFNRGFKYFLLEKSELAVYDFNEAVKLGVKDPYLYYFRGASFVALEEYDKAIENFTAVIKMDSSFEMAYVMRGNRYFSKEDFSKALYDYNKAIELNRNDDKLYIMRGKTYESLGNYKKALKDWQKVKKMGGKNIEIADELIEQLNEKKKKKK